MDEGKKHKLNVMVHAVSAPAMLAAVEGGRAEAGAHAALRLADARPMRQGGGDAGVEVLSSAGFGVPVFGVFNKDNIPTFRDGKPVAGRDHRRRGTGTRGGVEGGERADALGRGSDLRVRHRHGLSAARRASSTNCERSA